MALALLSLLVAAGTVLAFGACLRALIDRGFAQGRPDVLNYALASLLAVAFVLAIASGARFYLVSWLGERVVGTCGAICSPMSCGSARPGSRSSARAT